MDAGLVFAGNIGNNYLVETEATLSNTTFRHALTTLTIDYSRP